MSNAGHSGSLSTDDILLARWRGPLCSSLPDEAMGNGKNIPHNLKKNPDGYVGQRLGHGVHRGHRVRGCRLSLG